jgi:PAS domain S-box-containing protein
MYLNSEAADQIVDVAVEALSGNRDRFADILDQLPAAIYVTDREGTITYFNRACADLVGRTPQVGRDKWCVTWKLYTASGQPLPHDQCPMAVAIREQRPVRQVEAIAERPDGSRFNFRPYPTPMFDADGNLVGAVNLLLEVSTQRQSDYFREQAARCRRLATSVTDRQVIETLTLMAAKYDEQALKASRATDLPQR